ncbi:MAG: hypothetical protein M3R00_10585, partial [Pseudomonadota bacterium]|nr:hypothetical protein [Pseudomonadota bacterium]
MLVEEESSNYLGIRPNHMQPKRKWYQISNPQPLPWLSDSVSRRMQIKRKAYIDLSGSNQHADFVKTLQDNSIEVRRFEPNFFLPEAGKELLEAEKAVLDLLNVEDNRLFQDFVRTRNYAMHHGGMVGSHAGRNTHLAEIITLFSHLYGNVPKDNPILRATLQSLLDDGSKIEDPGMKREVVLRYMKLIALEIARIIDMTPAQIEMAFPDDNVKHIAVVRQLKLSFNRLADEAEFGFRFYHRLNSGFEEKANEYELREYRPADKNAHVELQKKLSMRTTKGRLAAFAFTSALIIAIGQVAIAVFAATGPLAIAIGCAALLTNTMLFTRDIKALLITLVKFELFRGLSWRLKVPLAIFGSCALATGIINGGLVMTSLVAPLGFTVLTAPVIVMIGAGLVAGLTVLGISSLLAMVGVKAVKALRGMSRRDVARSIRGTFDSFVHNPPYNDSVNQLVNKMNTLNENNPEYVAIQKKVAWLKFEHNTRWALKLVFSIVLIPAAVITAVVATYALSKISATATSDTLKSTLGWT